MSFSASISRMIESYKRTLISDAQHPASGIKSLQRDENISGRSQVNEFSLTSNMKEGGVWNANNNVTLTMTIRDAECFCRFFLLYLLFDFKV